MTDTIDLTASEQLKSHDEHQATSQASRRLKRKKAKLVRKAVALAEETLDPAEPRHRRADHRRIL